MRNIRGDYGFINMDGNYGSASYMTQVNDPEFWSYIEAGIKPMVEVLIKHRINTFGSCQGHYVPGKPALDANVRYYRENEAINQKLTNCITLFNDRAVILSPCSDVQLGNKFCKTDRITFRINPEKREELNALIERFAKFLDVQLSV